VREGEREGEGNDDGAAGMAADEWRVYGQERWMEARTQVHRFSLCRVGTRADCVSYRFVCVNLSMTLSQEVEELSRRTKM